MSVLLKKNNQVIINFIEGNLNLFFLFCYVVCDEKNNLIHRGNGRKQRKRENKSIGLGKNVACINGCSTKQFTK